MKMEMDEMPQLEVRLCRNCVDYKLQRDLYFRKFQKFERKLGEMATNRNTNLLRDAEKEIEKLKEILSQKIKLQEEEKKLENERSGNSTLDAREEVSAVPSKTRISESVTEPESREWERASYQICRWSVAKKNSVPKMCRQVFTTAQLLTHIWEKHSGNTTCFWHQCQVYGLPFKDADELLAHVRFHVYRCTFGACSRGFSCGRELEEHRFTHMVQHNEVAVGGAIAYRCRYDYCQASFDDARQMARHNRVTHSSEDEMFKCTEKKFNKLLEVKSSLEDSGEVGSSDRPLRCEFPGCGHASKHRGTLVQHCLQHFQK